MSTAVLAALANMVGGIASAGSSSPSIPRAARGGQNAIQQVSIESDSYMAWELLRRAED